MTRAMILAAGFGTRLGDLSDQRPKPLLPVCDVPLIRYAIALLAGHGVRDVVINLHHRGDMIENELGDGSGQGVRIQYSREDSILGTAGGIRRALPLLGDEPFFVVNGKILVDLDLAAALQTHRDHKASATLVVRPDAEAQRWGAIDAPSGGGRIRSMLGKGDFMFTGIHVLEPSLVERFPDDGQARCIVRDGYVPWLASGESLAAHVCDGYFMEHSTPERYLRGNINALRGRATISHVPAPLTGVDADARVAKTATLHSPVRVGAGAVIGDGAIVGPDVVVGRRASITAGVTVSRTVIWSDAAVTEDADHCIVTPTGRLQVPGHE